MTVVHLIRPLPLILLLNVAYAAQAQTALPAQTAQPASIAQPASGTPAPLVVYFDTASTKVRPQDKAVLDHAARLYSEGKPIVMVVSGATDSVGRPDQNLILSQERASAVLRDLLARGIPADRFQMLAKGETEPAVPGAAGTAEERNRRVEITWR